jgi:hypothetical protein
MSGFFASSFSRCSCAPIRWLKCGFAGGLFQNQFRQVAGEHLGQRINLIKRQASSPLQFDLPALFSHGLPDLVFWEDFASEDRHKLLISLVPVERIELPTFGLQNRCSTAELNRHKLFRSRVCS